MEKQQQTALTSRIGKERLERLARLCGARIKSQTAALEPLWAKRDNYSLQSQDQFDWRKAMGEKDTERPTAIFSKQNDSVNVIGGFAEFMTARTIDDLLGSEPFFSVVPEGKSDKVLAETMQRHAEWRMRKSGIEAVFAEAIASAYQLGEGIVKLTYSPRKNYFERAARVAVYAGTSNYVLTTKGEYIFEEDEIVQDQDAAIAATEAQTGMPVTDAMPPEAMEPARIYPAKDPETDLTGIDYEFMDAYVEDFDECDDPLDSKIIHHRDFIYSTTAASLDDSDFYGHLFDLRLSEADRLYKLPEDLVALIKDETQSPKSAKEKPEDGTDEQPDDIPYEPEEDDPKVQFCECYIKTVVDGKPTRIVVIYCVKAERIVAADYLGNVTPKGKAPFHIVRPFPVRNRIYGRGYFEIYQYAQEFIERHLNYIAYRNRHHANPTRMVKRDLIKNIAEGQDIPISPDTALELEQKANPKDAISFVEYPDLDSRTWDLMQMMVQFVQLRSGITSASQGGVDALPQNSTATGVEAILNSGNTLSKLPIRHIRRSLQDALRYALLLIYSNLNEEETFTYLEGENAKLLKLTRKQVHNLDYDIHLTMTRFRAREQRESAQASLNAVGMYLQTPEPEKEAVRPLYIDILRNLGQQDAERIIRRALPPPPPGTPPPPPPM